jgi:hypothetical protein
MTRRAAGPRLGVGSGADDQGRLRGDTARDPRLQEIEPGPRRRLRREPRIYSSSPIYGISNVKLGKVSYG